jgi:O-antigen/teichoic acid export membrane protein
MSFKRTRKLIAELTPKGRLAKGVVAITMGSGFGQLIVLVASPFITRLYSPDEFGVLAVYTGILGIVTVVASLRYQLAIVLPRTDGSAANILVLALLILFGTVIIASIFVAIFGQSIGSWTNAPNLVPYLWLLPVGIALAGSYQIFNYWAIRSKDFNVIAQTKVHQSASMVGVQILCGVLQAGPVGLIIGQILGQASGLARLVRNAVSGHRHLLTRVNKHRLLQKARRYRDFPIYMSLAGVLNKAGSQLPLILLSALFSPAIAGFYLLAYRITNRPAGLLSQSIRQVFLSGAATASREGRLGDITTKAFSGLTRIGFAPLVFLGIIAPELFGVLFGADWTEAGNYVQWMVPWLIASFVASPLTTLNVVLERQRFGLFFQASLLIAKLGGMLIGASLGGPLMTIACYSIASTISYLVFGIWISCAAGASFRTLLKALGGEAIAVLPFALLLWILKPGIQPELVSAIHLGQATWFVTFAVVAVAVILWRSVFYMRRNLMAGKLPS